ncbi:MAG: hypothetical protein K0M46_10355 [Thiobacillus sp.]|nr:hypothetical protein [Thiobacillus sp.]
MDVTADGAELVQYPRLAGSIRLAVASQRLFARTTRKFALTDHGRAYYEQCREALAKIEDAERAIGGRRGAPSGTLRVSLPTTYAHYRVLPRLPAFIHRYPGLELEMNVSNRNIDVVGECYDLAIPLGEPKDSGLVGCVFQMEEKRGHCGSLVDQNRHLTSPVNNVLRRTIGTTVYRLGHRVENGDPGFDDLTSFIRPEHHDRDWLVDGAEPVHAPCKRRPHRAVHLNFAFQRRDEICCTPSRQGLGKPDHVRHSSKKASVRGTKFIFGMRALQLG